MNANNRKHQKGAHKPDEQSNRKSESPLWRNPVSFYHELTSSLDYFFTSNWFGSTFIQIAIGCLFLTVVITMFRPIWWAYVTVAIIANVTLFAVFKAIDKQLIMRGATPAVVPIPDSSPFTQPSPTPTSAPATQHAIRRIPPFGEVQIIVRYGKYLCEAITATPQSPHDRLNLGIKATEAIKQIHAAFAPGVTPGGIQSIVSTGWPLAMTEALGETYSLTVGIARSLGWQQLLEGFPLNLQANDASAWATGETFDLAGRLANLIDRLWTEAMTAQHGKLFMSPATAVEQPPSPTLPVVKPPISRSNPGRIFQVAKGQFGNWAQDATFSEHQFRQLHPAPLPHPGVDPVHALNDYYDELLDGHLKSGVIRVIA